MVKVGRVAKEWSFSLTVKITEKLDGANELIRINNVKKNNDKPKPCCDPGTRIPAIFVKDEVSKLYICTAIGKNGNSCWLDKDGLPLKKEVHVKIEQKKDIADGKYYFFVYKNGDEVHKKENPNPEEFNDAIMYAAASQKAGKATLKGVQFQNLGKFPPPLILIPSLLLLYIYLIFYTLNFIYFDIFVIFHFHFNNFNFNNSNQ